MSELVAFTWSAATDAVVALLLLAAIFVPLEKAYPAAPQPSVRDASRMDLAFFVGQQLCFGFAILAALAQLRPLAAALPLEGLREAFHRQPLALCSIEVVMLGDLLAYWGHRAQHHYEWLWRFHRVHHSSTRLDWLAAHREHPLDGLYTQTLINLPLLIFGFSFHAAAGIVVFRAVWAVLIHANVRLPLGPLGLIFGSPELHHLHHARDRQAVNFGNLAPWTDWLFGTHARATGSEPEALGLREPLCGGYVRTLIEPVFPRCCHSLVSRLAVGSAAWKPKHFMAAVSAARLSSRLTSMSRRARQSATAPAAGNVGGGACGSIRKASAR